MVQKMGRCGTPKERIENLLHVTQMHFPEQPIDWDYLLDEFAIPSHMSLLMGQCFKKECNILSCAAYQHVWKLLPLMFGVIKSEIWSFSRFQIGVQQPRQPNYLT